MITEPDYAQYVSGADTKAPPLRDRKKTPSAGSEPVYAPGVFPGGEGLIRFEIIDYTINPQGEQHSCIEVAA